MIVGQTIPVDDADLMPFLRSMLFSAVIGDVLDSLGYRHQFLPPEIQPLSMDMVLVGRAMPVIEQALVEGADANKPFGLMFRALDDLQAHEIYMCNAPGGDFALWGELMSVRAARLGAAGAIVDGYSRDTSGILKLKFPTFSRGRYGQDQGVRGQVVDFRQSITYANGVTIVPGDLIFGDLDGIVAIPRDIEREVIQLAVQKVSGESAVRSAIEAGMSTQEAFDRYGIM